MKKQKIIFVAVWVLLLSIVFGNVTQAAWRMGRADISNSSRSDGLCPVSTPVLAWDYWNGYQGIQGTSYTFVPDSIIVGNENESYVLQYGVGIVALDRNGNERWRVSRDVTAGGLALGESGQLYSTGGYTCSSYTAEGVNLWSDYLGWLQGGPIIDSAGIIYTSQSVHNSVGQRIGGDLPSGGSVALPPGGGLSGHLYVPNGDGHLCAYQLKKYPDPSQQYYWDRMWLGDGYGWETSVAPNGTIYLLNTSYNNINTGISATNSDGSSLWSWHPSSELLFDIAVAADSTLRVVSSDQLTCLGTNGQELWTLPLHASFSDIVVDMAGTSYLTESWYESYKYHFAMTAVDASGNTIWRLTDDSIQEPITGIVLGEEGRIYVTSYNHILAFDVPEPATLLLIGFGMAVLRKKKM